MTVRLLAAYPYDSTYTIPAGRVVALAAETEAGLIADKLAVASAGPVDWEPPAQPLASSFAASLQRVAGGGYRVLLPDGAIGSPAMLYGPRTLWVESGTPTPTIEDAIARATALSPTYDAPVTILLAQGTVNLEQNGGTVLPAYTRLVGAGQMASKIRCTGNRRLRMRSGCEIADLSVVGDGTLSVDAGLIQHADSQIKDAALRRVNVFLPQATRAAVDLRGYNHNLRIVDCNIWSSSVGIRARGWLYVYGTDISVAGNNTGTPYIAVDIAGTGYMQFFGCKLGTGYLFTDVPGFPANMEITNDASAAVYGVRMATGTAAGAPRVNLFDCFSFVANSGRTANDINCVYNDHSGGWVRVHGGQYQAESANFASPTFAQGGSGIIEVYASRYSKQSGEIRGYAGISGIQTKTVANNNQTLDENGTDGVILCDATGGSFTLRLNNPGVVVSTRIGSVFRFKKINSANTVTIEVANSGTIDGAANVQLSAQWSSTKLVCTANGWVVMP